MLFRSLYRRKTRYRVALDWTLVDAMVAFDRKSDGMYPLVTNDRNLTGAQILEAHKGQPRIEKRFSQLKCVHEIAPVFLKNEGRIEALFLLYFLGLLAQGLIERELRLGMEREGIPTLPLYPEERLCSKPTVEQVFRLFAHAERHELFAKGERVRTFSSPLTDLQRQVLALMRVPREAYGV